MTVSANKFWELTECWRQFARPPDQQPHCLATILDDVDGVRVGHALRLVAINLQDLVTHLLQRLYTLYINIIPKIVAQVKIGPNFNDCDVYPHYILVTLVQIHNDSPPLWLWYKLI